MYLFQTKGWYGTDTENEPQGCRMDRNRKRRMQLLAGLQVLAAAAITGAIAFLLYRYIQYGEQAAREAGTSLLVGNGETAGTEFTGAELAGAGISEDEKTGTENGTRAQGASAGSFYGDGKLPGTIRVRILDSELTGGFHREIRVSCEKSFTVKLDGKRVKKGKSYALSAAELEEGQVVELCPKDGFFLTVENLNRAAGHPQYAGMLRLYREAEGIALVNELPLEEYLCGVVSSEMPSDYPLEAQKAQAVCARTYACNCIRNTRGEDFGADSQEEVSESRQENASKDLRGKLAADLDDSVSYQVYNNYQATEQSRRAVEETAGEILPLLEIQYYSTSCQSEHREDLDSDEAFRTFLSQEPDAGAEYDSPWLRWETELSARDILQSLTSRYGWQADRIEEIRVAKREGNGQVTELEIRSGDSVRVVSGEYTIRQVLSPSQATLRLRDGEEHAGMSSLPSAFFWLDPVRQQDSDVQWEQDSERKATDEGMAADTTAGKKTDTATDDGETEFDLPIDSVVIHGGGYGHGIGMSQYGAAALAEKGLDYREILEYYYDAGVVNH